VWMCAFLRMPLWTMARWKAFWRQLPVIGPGVSPPPFRGWESWEEQRGVTVPAPVVAAQELERAIRQRDLALPAALPAHRDDLARAPSPCATRSSLPSRRWSPQE